MCRLFLFVNVLLILLIGCCAWYFFNAEQKIVFVNGDKVFQEFYMTKDIENVGTNKVKQMKADIDSVYVKLSKETQSNIKEALVRELSLRNEELDVFQRDYVISNEQKIWDRMKMYSKKFSEERKIDLIIGAQHKGDILYGKETIDMTEELLKYINEKYEGLK